MNSHVDVGPVEAAALGKAPLKQRLSMVCYLMAIAVAMLGWLTAFGWAAVEVVKWLTA
jgi:hypothetical protein